MKVHFHDDTTHFATATVDYEYQAEQHVIDATKDFPECVRVEVPALGREWKRGEDGEFHET